MVKLLLPPNNNIFIDGKSVFNLYLQLKNHFNGRGDVIKKNWNMKVSDSSYNNRKDKMFFERLSKKYKLKELCLIFIGNLVANQNSWIGDISDADPLEFYNLYLAKLKALKSRYVDDVKNIYYFSKKMDLDKLSNVFEYNERMQTSYIFKLLQSNIITFETFIMLDSFLNIINEHDKHDNIVWSSYSVRLKAYKKLFIFDADECKQIFIDSIKSVKY